MNYELLQEIHYRFSTIKVQNVSSLPAPCNGRGNSTVSPDVEVLEGQRRRTRSPR